MKETTTITLSTNPITAKTVMTTEPGYQNLSAVDRMELLMRYMDLLSEAFKETAKQAMMGE